MSNTERLWMHSVKFMFTLGNLVLLQLCTILLLLIQKPLLTFPIIIIVNTKMISDYIFNGHHFTFKNYFSAIKSNLLPIFGYGVILLMLAIAKQYNIYIQKLVIEMNIGFYSETILIIFATLITCTLLTFFIFFPLVNESTNQTLLMKLKITFMMPFISIKATLFISILTVLNGIFVTSNLLFLLLFGPQLLIATNIIIFNNLFVKQKGE